MKKEIFLFLLILIFLISLINVNAQEKFFGSTTLNFTVVCIPSIIDFTLSPLEVYLGQDIAFVVTFSNCETPVNVTSNITIYKNGEFVANIVKAYGHVNVSENVTIVSSWTPNEIGNYIASAQVIYDGNVTKSVNASFKVISLPPVAPPVVAPPPIVVPPPLPLPAISVDAPKEILLYVNETGSFIIFVKNIGNVNLFNLSVNFISLPNISIDITPTFFDKMEVNETKSFLVKMLSTQIGEMLGKYYVKSDKVTVEKTIKIITRERIPPVNVTELKANIKALEEMINATYRILAMMYAYGYPVEGMFAQLNNVSNYLSQSLQALSEGRYDLAQSLFSQAYPLTQEIVNETYKIAKEREKTYSEWERYLFLALITVVVIVAFLIVKTFRYIR